MGNIFLEFLSGFATTVLLFVATLVLSLPLGLIIVFLSISKNKAVSSVTRFFISIIRGTPLMLQIIIIFYGPGLVFGAGVGIKNRIIACIIAFGINYACYFSEIYRGGIESIAKGQYEAGHVLGMTKSQIFFKVILLQVIKRIVAPMGNEIITLVKDTSLARTIAVVELTDIAYVLRREQGGGIWPLLAAGVFYYVFNLLIAFILRRVEKRLDYFKA